MSGLERTTDALLERKAIQLSNHQRAQTRIDDTLLKIRTHTVSARSAAADIARLREDMKLHDEDLKASDDAAAHLADRHMLQTATTNAETDKAVAFGRAFKDLSDCSKGLVERISLGIETGAAMAELTRAHGAFLRKGLAVGRLVSAVGCQHEVLRACRGVAGHRSSSPTPPPIDSAQHSPLSHNTATISQHPLLLLSFCAHGSDSAPTTAATPTVASSTAAWDCVLRSVEASISDLNAQRDASVAEHTTLLGTIEGAKTQLLHTQLERAAVAAASQALRAQIDAVQAAIERKRAERAALEGEGRAALDTTAGSVKSSIAAKEKANATAQQANEARCKLLEGSVVDACDAKHDAGAIVDGFRREQADLTKAVAEAESAATARRRALCAKVAAAQRLEQLLFTAAQRVLTFKRSSTAARERVGTLRERHTRLQRLLAEKEDDAMRFEWSVEHAKRCEAAAAQLVGDEALLRRRCEEVEWPASFAYFERLSAASVAEVEARRVVAEVEEPAEWAEIVTAAVNSVRAAEEAQKAREDALAMSLIMAQQQQRAEAAKKRPRDPAAPSALMTGHRALLDASQSHSGLLVPSTPMRGGGSRNNKEAAPATPSRLITANQHPATPTTTATTTTATTSSTMANAQALLASTSSLLLEASKPIQPMTTMATLSSGGGGNFIALGGGGGKTAASSVAMGGSLLLSATPRRQQQQHGLNASQNITAMTPRSSGPKLLPLPPGTTLPSNAIIVNRSAAVGVAVGSVARAGSEESVISLFRSVSMPQQQHYQQHQSAVLTMANLGKSSNLLLTAKLPASSSSSALLLAGHPHHHTAKVPSSVADWNPIPPSPTPTDLGGGAPMMTMGGGGANSGVLTASPAANAAALSSGENGAPLHHHHSCATEESEDEISLSRLVQQQHPTATPPSAFNKRTAAATTPTRGSGGGSGGVGLIASSSNTNKVAAKGKSPSPRKPAKGHTTAPLPPTTTAAVAPNAVAATPTRKPTTAAAVMALMGNNTNPNANSATRQRGTATTTINANIYNTAAIVAQCTPTRTPFSNITNQAVGPRPSSAQKGAAVVGGGGGATVGAAAVTTGSGRKSGGSGDVPAKTRTNAVPRGAVMVTPRGKKDDDDFTAAFGL